MTTKDQFSPEEWTQVAALPGAVMMAAGLADGHMVPSVREMTAGTSALAAVVKAHPENAVLQELLAARPAQPEIDKSQVANIEQAVAALTEEIRQGVEVARAKLAPEEYAQLAEALGAAARAAVERLGDGFMGSGKEKVDAGEKQFIDTLSAIFG